MHVWFLYNIFCHTYLTPPCWIIYRFLVFDNTFYLLLCGLITYAEIIFFFHPKFKLHGSCYLQEVIFRELLIPILRLVSSTSVSYPGGSRVRTVICHKLVDTLYMISLRIGFEMTREHMTFILQKFFAAFNRVYDEKLMKNKPGDTITSKTDAG